MLMMIFIRFEYWLGELEVGSFESQEARSEGCVWIWLLYFLFMILFLCTISALHIRCSFHNLWKRSLVWAAYQVRPEAWFLVTCKRSFLVSSPSFMTQTLHCLLTFSSRLTQ